MYICFNDGTKRHNLRDMSYNRISNGELNNELSCYFDTTDSDAVAEAINELESLVGLTIDKVIIVGDNGNTLHEINEMFKIDSLHDGFNEDGRRDLNLRLVRA